MAVDWDKIRDGFTAALQLEPELRLPFVHHLAGPNDDLRRELEALLRAHADATASLTLLGGSASPPSVNADAAPPLDPRFSIQYRIGEGGMGTVYLAIDTEHGARVAVKTIGRMNASALLRFKNEFRALADVAHPNLVRLFELRGDGMTWFFTMEFVEGLPFLRYVRRTESDAAAASTTSGVAEPHQTPVRPVQAIATNLDEDRLRLAFPQLVEAVAAIHAAGKLHCDLKPSNVLVATDTGRVVVLDFGLIAEIDAPIWATSGRSVVGTVAFMSPEQARAEALSEASDWYSVGVILYQALTGRLPIDGADFVEILTLKQTTAPTPPRELNPSAPDDLSRLAMQLLDRDAPARPGGREILRRLERRAPSAPESKGAFIGRAAQLAQLHDALRDVRAGSQKTAYVHGASGAGKSALIRQFLHELPATVLVLSGRCYERESVPYKALDAVMDAIATQLAIMDNAAEFLDPDVAYLARVFPVLLQVAAVRESGADAAPIADVQEVRRRASRGLRQLLRRLSGRYLLVVAIDDLQWSDLDSTMLMQSLLAAPHAPRLLFLGSYRSEHADSSPVLTRLLQHDSTALKVHVGQLSDDEARALARGRSSARVTADALEMIVREARGVPLFVEQLAHALDEAGPADHEGLSFDTVLRRRLAGLDLSSRRLLEHIVVGGQPLPQAAIVEAAGVPPEQALRDLAALRAQQWVRGEGVGKDDNIEPFHDRIRESIVDALSSDELISRHQALAQALEPIGVDPEILVVHWSGCGRYEKATHYARRAADRAAETLAFNRAARLYGQALEWQGPDSADARALEQNLADALAHAGLSLEAGDAYLRASRHRDVAEALLFKQRAAEQYLNHGHVEKGFEVLDDLVRAVGLPMPKHGLHAVLGLQIERLRLWARGIRRVGPPRAAADVESLRLDVCLTVGRGLSMIEPIQGAEYQTRACRLALDLGDPKRIALTLAIEAALEVTAGYRARRRVARLLERSDQVSAQLDDVHVSAHTRLLRGVTHYLQGEWAPALECCRDAEVLFRERCRNAWWEIDQSASFALWTLNHMGRMAEVARRRGPLLKEASERGDRILRNHITTGNNVLAPLSQGEDPERVRAELVEAVKPFSGQGYHMPHLLRMFGLVEIELFRQDGLAAHAMIDGDLRHIRSSLLMEVQFLRIEVLGQRARCGLAAAAADPRARRGHLETVRRCVRALERIGSPWPVAYATPLHAELTLIDGNTEASVALLKTAVARYDALDMSLRAAAVAYRLGEVVGGNEGLAIRAASTSRMRMLGVTNPAAIARGFMPSVL
jgi:tetratricopeptide (TPR) repeat protein